MIKSMSMLMLMLTQNSKKTPIHAVNSFVLSSAVDSLQTTGADGDLGGGSIDAAEGDSLAVGEGVHGVEGNVEARGGVVDGEDVNGLAVVGELPAGAALVRVPAGDGGGGTDVGEAGDLALGLPAVLGDQAVGSVGAGDGSQGAAAIIVAGVVGNYCDVLVMVAKIYMVGRKWCKHTSVGHGGGGESENAGNLGEEHFG